jgi:hypothetical protein
MKFDAKLMGKVGLAAARVMVPQIAQAEDAFKAIKSGPDKKKAVLEAVLASVEMSEALSGKEILNQQLLAEGLGELNDAIIKIQRAVGQ